MPPPVQTIEKTSKSIKLSMLLSTLGIIVGLWQGFAATDQSTAHAWWTLAVVSLIVRIGCGGARWWQNG